MAIMFGMAITSIKSTYSLDVQTVQKLEELAAVWNVPKSEVIRRAISQAAQSLHQTTADQKIQALENLQKHFKKKGINFDAWKKQIKEARR